jgi:hypothetical protein
MYAPEPIPLDSAELTSYLFRELKKLEFELAEVTAKKVQFVHREPARPREGNLYGADGTNWDPGSGAGVYVYYGNAWHFLG